MLEKSQVVPQVFELDEEAGGKKQKRTGALRIVQPGAATIKRLLQEASEQKAGEQCQSLTDAAEMAAAERTFANRTGAGQPAERYWKSTRS